MKKIDTKTIKKIIKEQRITEYYYSIGEDEKDMPMVGVYHKNNWDHGYDGNSGFLGTRRSFYQDFFEMINFLREFLNETKCSKCIIAPFKRYKYFEYYDETCDVFVELKSILNEHNIRINSQAGLEISLEEDFSVLEAFVEGAFRGVSLGCLYFSEINVLLTPTHHFEMSFWTYEVDKYAGIIEQIANKADSLHFYCR